MGWLYMSRWNMGGHETPKAYLDAQLTYERDTPEGRKGLCVLDSAVVGMRTYYAAAQVTVNGETIAPCDSNVLRRRAAYQTVIGQYVVGAAWGDWADWVPAGKVGVVFREVESVDALGHVTYKGPNKWGLVDAARYTARVDGDTFDSLGATAIDRNMPGTKEVRIATAA